MQTMDFKVSFRIELGDRPEQSRGDGLSFSPDGQFIALGCETGEIVIVDVSNGAILKRIPGHRGWCRVTLFSPDSRFLFSAGDDLLVKIWDTSTFGLIRTLTGHEAIVKTLASDSYASRIV